MKLLIALSLLMLSPFSKADNSAIAAIRKEYQLIQQSFPTYQSATIELDGYALEGADAKAYRDNAGHIRLIKAELFHETGKEFKNFYYRDGILIFALYVTHRYNQPTGITPAIAKQQGIEAFDPKKTLITEDRYYFANGKMIRWVGDNKKEEATNTKAFKDSQDMVLTDSTDLVSQFDHHPTSHSRPPR